MNHKIHIEKYMRGDVMVDAAEFHYHLNPDEIVNWINSESDTQIAEFHAISDAIVIETQEEYSTYVNRCVWVIKEPDGTFHPCRSDTFRDIYREANIVKKYVTVPVIVDAVQYMTDNLSYVVEWVNSKSENELTISYILHDGEIRIQTRTGMAVANIGDWIVKESDGSFFSMKDDIFRTNYYERGTN
jgi:hypothetical protein